MRETDGISEQSELRERAHQLARALNTVYLQQVTEHLKE